MTSPTEPAIAERVGWRSPSAAVTFWVSSTLCALWHGVESVVVQRIVGWRTQHGHFTGVGRPHGVAGVRLARFGHLKNLLVVR